MQGPPRPIRELESMVDHDIPWRTSSAVTSSIVDLWPDLSQVIHEAERLGWVPTFLLHQMGLHSFDISLGQCISVNVASIYCRRLKCPHPWKPVALYRTPCSSCPLEYNVEIHPMSAGGRPRVTCDIPHDDGATPRHFSLCTSTAAATATSGATVFSTLAVSHMFTRFSNNVSQYLYTVIYYISFIIYNDMLYSYFFLSSLSLLLSFEVLGGNPIT